MKYTVWRHRLTERLIPDHKTVECFPSPPPITAALLKIYLLQFLLPNTTYPAINEKLPVMSRGKKHNLKRKNIKPRHGKDVGIIGMGI